MYYYKAFEKIIYSCILALIPVSLASANSTNIRPLPKIKPGVNQITISPQLYASAEAFAAQKKKIESLQNQIKDLNDTVDQLITALSAPENDDTPPDSATAQTNNKIGTWQFSHGHGYPYIVFAGGCIKGSTVTFTNPNNYKISRTYTCK